MRQLFLIAVIWGLSCSLVSATEEQDSIYELAAIEMPAPLSIVAPLISVPDADETQTILGRFPSDIRSLFSAHSIPCIPLSQTSGSDHYYSQLRQWGCLETDAIIKPKQKSRGLLFTGGALLLSKLEEITAEQITQQEDFRFLNLYHGYRQR
ncbi:hypothetical protein Enr10x_45260 [Gimesia panareensis]|uniref:Uncharacterized protein n=1 Tax=Gimesia panareensis TaxID=2527978 RepID=A0A517QC24_9PLAN|nr:hypothetical protein [Gimesia panareensis]QDT29177.1 hypothetical protein Enr10x_45260 [Gimesia panareensis]